MPEKVIYPKRVAKPEMPITQFTLRQHVGKRAARVADGKTGELVTKFVDVALAQKEIMAGKFRVGYVGDQPNAPINLLHSFWTPEEEEEIKQRVASLRGDTPAFVSAPPPMDDEDEGNDDDTDEFDEEE